jgi:hypothetical protein
VWNNLSDGGGGGGGGGVLMLTDEDEVAPPRAAPMIPAPPGAVVEPVIPFKCLAMETCSSLNLTDGSHCQIDWLMNSTEIRCAVIHLALDRCQLRSQLGKNLVDAMLGFCHLLYQISSLWTGLVRCHNYDALPQTELTCVTDLQPPHEAVATFP